jgi:hypothetical protein
VGIFCEFGEREKQHHAEFAKGEEFGDRFGVEWRVEQEVERREGAVAAEGLALREEVGGVLVEGGVSQPMDEDWGRLWHSGCVASEGQILEERRGDALFELTWTAAVRGADIDLEVFTVRLDDAFNPFVERIELGILTNFGQEEKDERFLTNERWGGGDAKDTLESFANGFSAGEELVPFLLIESEGDECAVRELGPIGSGEDGGGCSDRFAGMGREERGGSDRYGETEEAFGGTPHGG